MYYKVSKKDFLYFRNTYGKNDNYFNGFLDYFKNEYMYILVYEDLGVLYWAYSYKVKNKYIDFKNELRLKKLNQILE